MTLRERIVDSLIINPSCAFWFVVSFKVVSTAATWVTGDAIVYFGV